MSENQTQKEYKVQDLINDSGVRNTLIKYNKDRGRGDLSAEDAVEEFLTDMRFINAGNEVSSIKFISYLNDLEENTQDDINYKKALAQTYQLVDQQVNVVTGKDVPFLERAEAVGDYLIGGITSPLNTTLIFEPGPNELLNINFPLNPVQYSTLLPKSTFSKCIRGIIIPYFDMLHFISLIVVIFP